MTAKRTIALDLDGYTDLPPGKIANVVTYLERKPPAAPEPPDPAFPVRRIEQPAPGWYRDLYRRIGEDWLWFSRAVMPDEPLAALLALPTTEVLALEQAGIATGLAELDFSHPGEVEVAMF